MAASSGATNGSARTKSGPPAASRRQEHRSPRCPGRHRAVPWTVVPPPAADRGSRPPPAPRPWCRTSRCERAVGLLDHRLQFFSRVLVGVFAALGVPVRRSGVLRDTHPQLSSREAPPGPYVVLVLPGYAGSAHRRVPSPWIRAGSTRSVIAIGDAVAFGEEEPRPMPSIQTSLLTAVPAGVGHTLFGLCMAGVRRVIVTSPPEQ